MSESEMALIKPEQAMKSFVWLQCTDGSIQQVEEEVAMFCPVIYKEILQTGMGSSKNYAISLPQRVNPAVLSIILDYCRFHQVPGRSNMERKSFDEKFIKIDTKRLCELTSAADSLQLKPLVELTSRALARMIEGKTPEEIRETFHLPDDLTEEEKLEPLKNANDDPRIRLLNRLYAKKRRELKERQKQKDVEVEEEKKDERSVDEILSFINGNGDSKYAKAPKNKKKNRRRKELQRDLCGTHSGKAETKDSATLTTVNGEAGNSSLPRNRRPEVSNNIVDSFTSKLDFEDGDIDDELDPAMKEELDSILTISNLNMCMQSGMLAYVSGCITLSSQNNLLWEVEDFARRLNSDWPERVQEILSFGQDKRFVPNLSNGNGSIQIYTGLDR